ncbi:MAG: class I mannose-6-phosphate isomerase [Prevotellaceae bacterium]|jgi:mannose-6-phosphate isomerase|nr:class I mannose-6-phosphate isomerase [Prevotellaceae bacterium]
MLYPLKFSPILKEKIWGGNKLGEIYRCKDAQYIGESWVLSGYAGDESVVTNGELAGQTLIQLIDTYKDTLLGKAVYEKFGKNFPLLFKLIDANDKLSIQVHPNDATAFQRHKSFGKTEMWYIIDAEQNSELIIGFNKDVTPTEYATALANGTLETLLQRVKVHAGDVFFIPAGLIHAIGKGILLAEIQQSSDITYRIYDYQRKDANGNERELHKEQAIDVINYKKTENAKVLYQNKINEFETLVNCKYFTTSVMEFSNKQFLDYGEIENFVVLLCVEGKFELKTANCEITVECGETVFLPANTEVVQLIPAQISRILEVVID